MKKYIVFTTILILLVSCSEKPQTELPQELTLFENIEVYSAEKSADSVILIRDREFGEIEDVLYGSMGEFTVDNSGRVYIEDGGWGSRSLHVYNPDGSYFKKIASEGRGPAEFLSLSNLQYRSGHILFSDSQLQRMMLFSTSWMEEPKTALYNPLKWKSNQEISGKRLIEFNLESENSIIGAFQDNPHPDNAGRRKKLYYRMNSDLEIISDKLIELKAKEFVHSKKVQDLGDTQVRLMKRFPFSERHFFIQGNRDHFYTVDSRHFLIKKHDSMGNFLSGFYYTFTPLEVRREDALKSANDHTMSIAEDVELPESWPAINSILIDDENRFWISTITKSDEYFQWWVLEESGELIAKFNWRGNRHQSPASLQDQVIVRNGYFYQREKKEENDQVSVVRYKIEFEGC